MSETPVSVAANWTAPPQHPPPPPPRTDRTQSHNLLLCDATTRGDKEDLPPFTVNSIKRLSSPRNGVPRNLCNSFISSHGHVSCYFPQRGSSGLAVTAAGDVMIVFLNEKALLRNPIPSSLLDICSEWRKQGEVREEIDTLPRNGD